MIMHFFINLWIGICFSAVLPLCMGFCFMVFFLSWDIRIVSPPVLFFRSYDKVLFNWFLNKDLFFCCCMAFWLDILTGRGILTGYFGMGFWHGILTWHFDRIFWNAILMWHFDMLFWRGILTWNFDMVFWHRILTWHSDIAFWQCIMKWYFDMAF